jgi:hypothetical protein
MIRKTATTNKPKEFIISAAVIKIWNRSNNKSPKRCPYCKKR